jgi:hypothetical protein
MTPEAEAFVRGFVKGKHFEQFVELCASTEALIRVINNLAIAGEGTAVEMRRMGETLRAARKARAERYLRRYRRRGKAMGRR